MIESKCVVRCFLGQDWETSLMILKEPELLSYQEAENWQQQIGERYCAHVGNQWIKAIPPTAFPAWF